MNFRPYCALVALIWHPPLWAADPDIPPVDARITLTQAATVDAPNTPEAGATLPASKDELFGADPAPKEAGGEIGVAPQPQQLDVGNTATTVNKLHGYARGELAKTYASPAHLSKARGTLELGSQGDFGQGVRWRLGGRIDYDAVYGLNDFYQPSARDRADFQLRETYLDWSAGGLDWRLGRQQIVWGEMVGMFIADVVSAKDLREFILPDFETLRIPQWAARGEYFDADFHAEMIWIPLPGYDRVGKPTDFTSTGSGTDFYPYPPAPTPRILDEVKPGNRPDHGNFGVRLNRLTRGWDLSGFFYTSMNPAATLYRSVPLAPYTYTPHHDRIWQTGGTLGKDFGDAVLKAEAVYTRGRRFSLIADPADADGVVEQDTLDWAVGLDYSLGGDTGLNAQFFQRYFYDHNPGIVPQQTENGVSLRLSHTFPGNWKAETLLVRSLNRRDWMLRPKASWEFRTNWKWSLGLDAFSGPATGLFGQYDAQDRVYSEIRHDF